MAAHSWLAIGETEVIISSVREDFSPALASMFLDSEEVEPGLYVSNARSIRERLRLNGHVSARASRLLAVEWPDRLYISDEAMRDAEPEALVADFAAQLGSPDRDEMGIHTPAGHRLQEAWGYCWGADLLQLQFLVDRVPDATRLSHDLREPLSGGHIPESTTRCADARAQLMTEASTAAPTIVLTEGTTDAFVLWSALRILRPDLVGFMSFLDYAHKPEGGVGSVANGLKAFAAAGVGNRVVGLFDNDTAGQEAMAALSRIAVPLPTRIAFTSLPHLSLAETYPTYGPDGLSTTDINGRAVSMELFLGRDVLEIEGTLVPVQWTRFVQSLGAYQGEVTRKAELQKRFAAKVAAVDAGGSVGAGDWTALRELLDHLLSVVE